MKLRREARQQSQQVERKNAEGGRESVLNNSSALQCETVIVQEREPGLRHSASGSNHSRTFNDDDSHGEQHKEGSVTGQRHEEESVTGETLVPACKFPDIPMDTKQSQHSLTHWLKRMLSNITICEKRCFENFVQTLWEISILRRNAPQILDQPEVIGASQHITYSYVVSVEPCVHSWLKGFELTEKWEDRKMKTNLTV